MTSFPYLKISRDRGVPYGEVIRYAQVLDFGLPMDPAWYLEGAWERDVCVAWWAERERRAESCRSYLK